MLVRNPHRKNNQIKKNKQLTSNRIPTSTLQPEDLQTSPASQLTSMHLDLHPHHRLIQTPSDKTALFTLPEPIVSDGACASSLEPRSIGRRRSVAAGGRGTAAAFRSRQKHPSRRRPEQWSEVGKTAWKVGKTAVEVGKATRRTVRARGPARRLGSESAGRFSKSSRFFVAGLSFWLCCSVVVFLLLLFFFDAQERWRCFVWVRHGSLDGVCGEFASWFFMMIFVWIILVWVYMIVDILDYAFKFNIRVCLEVCWKHIKLFLKRWFIFKIKFIFM